MKNVNIKKERLDNAVITGRNPSDIIKQYEIPMKFYDYLTSKTMSGLTAIASFQDSALSIYSQYSVILSEKVMIFLCDD